MDIEILHSPGSAAARVRFAPGEELICEAGSLIALSPGLSVETTLRQRAGGGVMQALARGLAGESWFLNHYRADARGGELLLAPDLIGDLSLLELKEEALVVQAGAFVACQPDVHLDFNWQGFKSLLSGESLFWLRCSGSGKLLLNSFGCIYTVEVDGEYVVDTGHIVAFDETLDFSLSKAGGSWISSFLGGEGIACRFKGRGRLWCQSHNEPGFGRTLGPLLPPK